MYVIDVIPFAAGAPAGALSYRSNEKMTLGALVDITLRSTRVRGIVVGCESVREAKGSLKTAHFALKSGTLAKAGALPAAVIRAAQEVALYHAAPLGSVLALLGDVLPEPVPALHTGSGYKQQAIEMPYLERIAAYERIVSRAEGAVLLVAPTTIELQRLGDAFAERQPVLLSGALKGEKRAAAIEKAAHTAGLVIATPSFIWTPIAALETIVLERAGAGSYSFPKRPYLDARVAADGLARARKLTLALGDYPLPLEWRKDPAAPVASIQKAGAVAREPARVRLYDARAEKVEGEKFKAVPDALMRGIGKAIASGGRAAVLAVRRGYAPTVVCRDCGSAVRDAEGRPLSFSTARGERVFRSADGSTVESANRVCDVCGSWNLLPLGIGVERVAEEIREALPDARILSLDADTVRTPAQAKRAAHAAREAGTVIIGTELMLPFLDPSEPVEFAAIASADSLLSLPFWRARDRLVHSGLSLRERSKALTIATRRAEDSSFTAITDPHASAFFAEETALREQFGYPPFGSLLRVRAVVTASRREAAAREITDAFQNRPVMRMPDRAAKGRAVVTVLCKMASGLWPDETLSRSLAALPPSVSVLINSESLW